MANSTASQLFAASTLPELPSYTLSLRPPLIAGIPDVWLQLAAPIVAYWVVSLLFHMIDEFDLFPQYRLHTPAEIAKRNRATRWEVIRDVILQQFLQTIAGLAVAAFDPPEMIGKEQYEVAAWALALRRIQAWTPLLLRLCGLDPAPLSGRLWKSYPTLAAVVAGGAYPQPGFAPWELQVASFIYWVAVPLLQFTTASIIVDTWEYFLHRAMHMNKYLYNWIHSRHHRLYVPYAFGALYNHPLEGFLLETVGAGMSYLLTGMTVRQGMVFFTLSTIKTVDDHCGYALPWDPMQHLTSNNAAYHDIHHQSWGIKTNFSQPFFTFWDHFFGTMWKGDVKLRYERDRAAAQRKRDTRDLKQASFRSPRRKSGFEAKTLTDRVADLFNSAASIQFVLSQQPDAIQRFTSVLRLLPDTDHLEYSNWVLSSIKALPPPLKRRSILSALFSRDPQKSSLCQLHSRLNVQLVDALYDLLAAECTDRLQNLVINASLLPAKQQVRIKRVQECHHLCMHPELYLTTPQPDTGPRSFLQTSKCPACCIVRLAAHPAFLLDLLVVTRSRHDKRPATIIPYLDSFISFHSKALGSQVCTKLSAAVQEETAALRACRRKLHRMRIESGLKGGEPIQGPAEAEDDASISSFRSTSAHVEAEPEPEPYDSVLSIVNMYDSLRSSQLPGLDHAVRPKKADTFVLNASLLCNASCSNLDSDYKASSASAHLAASSSESTRSSSSSSNRSSNETPRASSVTLMHRKTAYRALVGSQESLDGLTTHAIARKHSRSRVQAEGQREDAKQKDDGRVSLPFPPVRTTSAQPNTSLARSTSVSHYYPRSDVSSAYSQAGLSTYATEVPIYLDMNDHPPLPQAPPIPYRRDHDSQPLFPPRPNSSLA
ncbi:hypothetical protein DV738_g2131, partial [Chaetothyriales sp. CBS 135597]